MQTSELHIVKTHFPRAPLGHLAVSKEAGKFPCALNAALGVTALCLGICIQLSVQVVTTQHLPSNLLQGEE